MATTVTTVTTVSADDAKFVLMTVAEAFAARPMEIWSGAEVSGIVRRALATLEAS